ncbi:hypothetical protein K501DRAFT_287024 [Backusella circina FSU 941]|nr:hypothetical protein K501DRAFT_287024 [Backusella circina FSU 941]
MVDEQGEEATTFVEEKSFRLKSLTDLRKYIKNQEVQFETTPADTVMEEATSKRERNLEYNVYTNEDRRRYFYFIQEKLMKPKQAAVAANVNYDTARKWRKAYNDDPEKKVPTKMMNLTMNRPVSQLNDVHKAQFVNFFDEDSTATIQDAVENLTKSFEGLEIKKVKGSRVYEGRVQP